MKYITTVHLVTHPLLACFLSLVAGLHPSQLNGSEPDFREFESIFDGKTLQGWEATPPGSDGAWQVANGIITGTGGKTRGYLTYADNKNIANLELKFSYRFPGKGNSGVSIRAIPDPTKTRGFQSYHADLGHLGIGKQVLGAWDFHTPGRTEHRCFRGDRLVIDVNDRPQISVIKNGLQSEDIRRGEWNHVHIIARDNHFLLYINGKLASEFTEHLPKEKRLKRGMLQLQLHDPDMVVEFKNIFLKILDEMD
ncbi:MAG: hypothetical protein CMM01_17745 [Rhodopirellula sp.]|nr:hypothetical protein [Rhodopirellula sp.]